MFFDECFCRSERVGFADIEHGEVCRAVGGYFVLLHGLQVKINDGKFVGEAVHEVEYAWRHYVDTCEGVGCKPVEPELRRFCFAGRAVVPSAQRIVVVEYEVAACIPFAYDQRGEAFRTMGSEQFIKRQCRKNIYIVYQDGFIALEKGCRMAQSATGVEQHVLFVRYVDSHAIIVTGKEVDDLSGVVVHVDDGMGAMCCRQFT